MKNHEETFLTLNQIGALLLAQAKQVPPRQRASVSEVMKLLQAPVGCLKRKS